MARYARRDASDYAVDVVDAADAAAAAAMFGKAFEPADFYLVPDDTRHAAKLTFDGSKVTGIQNPPDPKAPDPVPQATLSPAKIIRLMRTVIGNAAFMAIVDSPDPDVRAWVYEFEHAKDMTKVQFAEGLAALVSFAALADAQRIAMLAAWPTA